MYKYLGVLLVLFCVLGWADPGRLNVITDMPTAEIYVDGVLAGRDAIQNYEVDPGTHYVRVVYRNKTIYAKTHKVASGATVTVPTAHFVDFKTNVANRGAVDVEAARIRDTRGNFAIGAQGSLTTETASLGGVSIKKWFGERVGLQAIGWLDNQRTYSGGRVLFWIADKVVFNAPFSGYLYAGGGTDSYTDKDDAYNNIRTSVSNFGFGIEFSPFGVNGLFLSTELGLEKRFSTGQNPDVDGHENTGMMFSGGLYLYF